MVARGSTLPRDHPMSRMRELSFRSPSPESPPCSAALSACALMALLSMFAVITPVSGFTWGYPLQEAKQLSLAKTCGSAGDDVGAGIITWRPTAYTNDQWFGLCGEQMALLSDATGTLVNVGLVSCTANEIDTGYVTSLRDKLNDRVFLTGDTSAIYACGQYKQRSNLYKGYGAYVASDVLQDISYVENTAACQSGVQTDPMAYSRTTDTAFWRCGYSSSGYEYYSLKGFDTPKLLQIAPSGYTLNQIAAVWNDPVMNDTVYYLTDQPGSLPTKLIKLQNNQYRSTKRCSNANPPNGKSLFFSCRAAGLFWVDLTAVVPTFNLVTSCALGSGWAGSLSVTHTHAYVVCLSKQVGSELDPTPSVGEVRSYTIFVDDTTGAASVSGDYAVIADQTTCTTGLASIDARSSGVSGRPDVIWLGCSNYATKAEILLTNICGTGYRMNVTADGSTYQCSLCPMGTYQPSWTFKNDTTCLPCPSGTYSAAAGTGNCTACAVGSVSVPGSTTCTACTAGYYGAPGASSCVACSAGTYSTTQTAACTNCTYGMYSQYNNGSTICLSCQIGSYVPPFSSQCFSCDPGHVSIPGGCYECPPGTFSDQNFCTQCTFGQYAHSSASVNCTHCDYPFTTNQPGSVNASQCIMPYCTPDLGINTLTCISHNPIPASATMSKVTLTSVIVFQLIAAVVLKALCSI